VLAPSALGAAPAGLKHTGDPVMCRAWTLLGLPAANVPAWRRPDGLPIGVQFIGTGRDDVSYLTRLALAEAALTH
jgi:Asp-tRNA(Asn)/Glu-tRNA(Gln) amidotransferase A subunit family amidase